MTRVSRMSVRNTARLFDNHLPIRRVRVHPTISVTMANKDKVAKNGCARLVLQIAGRKSVRQGRSAIIRRPLDPTIRP